MIAGVKYEVIKDGKRGKIKRHRTKQKALDSASKTLNRKGGTVLITNITKATKSEIKKKNAARKKARKARRKSKK